MKLSLPGLALVGMLLPLVISTSGTAGYPGVGESDWPGWRGPTHDGIAAAGQQPPVNWTGTGNVLWRASVPGRGHSSPTVVGDSVYLTTADEQKEIQSVLCFGRADGRLKWKTDVHRGGFDAKGHKHKSQASASVACDGGRLYVNFPNAGGIFTTALTREGKPVWQRRVSDYVTHQGFGASPHLYQSLVIIAADHKGGGVLAALDRASGKVVWSNPRPALPNYTSPVVLRVAGREQLLLSGCNLVSSFEPLTGRTLWEVPGSTTECVVTMVTDGERVFTGGGYPRNHTVAIRADGSGQIAWENTVRVYVPSMIAHQGHVYAATDAGIAICWKSDTGEEVWKERLGGDFFAAPVLAAGHIYATNLRGTTHVFKADPAKFERVAENTLGDESYASPAICGGRVYVRAAARRDGSREEFLYCLGGK